MERFDVIVIGTGFGGTVAALSAARAMKARQKGERVLMLERGTWWTAPIGSVRDPQVRTPELLEKHGQPYQYWSTLNHFRGLLDIITRCFKRWSNADGLLEMKYFRRRGLPFIPRGDGISVLRASGVGGGSLIYSNIIIRPPNAVLDDPRWPAWPPQAHGGPGKRDDYFDTARDAIGRGVLVALDDRDARNGKPPANPATEVHHGLSNVVTRSARIDPEWNRVADPLNAKRGLKQLKPGADTSFWIDRARVFQTAVSKLAPDSFGTIDAAVNDLPPEWAPPAGSTQPSINYCERQGRCNVGCLPGARHTLNTQISAAVFGPLPSGPITGTEQGPLAEHLAIQAEREVCHVRKVDDGYEVTHRKTGSWFGRGKTTVHAKKVVFAAGCLGTVELLSRSRDKGLIPNLSDELGWHFATNGDYLAFLEKSDQRLSLARGPMTTSFAKFNKDGPSAASFHTIEDQGVPPAMYSALGFGIPLLRSLSLRGGGLIVTLFSLLFWGLGRFLRFLQALLYVNRKKQSPFFMSPEQQVPTMHCVIGMGRDRSEGRFKRGWFATKVENLDENGRDRAFHDDPVFTNIRATLDRFAQQVGGQPASDPASDPAKTFRSPFWERVVGRKISMVTHPLGGCVMAPAGDVANPQFPDAAAKRSGVTDACGRVLNTSGGVHKGLYVADASIVPTGLGVNPALTITAVSLVVADQVVAELDA